MWMTLSNEGETCGLGVSQKVFTNLWFRGESKYSQTCGLGVSEEVFTNLWFRDEAESIHKLVV